MERIDRRSFLRLGAGVFAAALFTRTPLTLFSSQDEEESWVAPKAARVGYLVGTLLINGRGAEQGDEIVEGDILQTEDNSEADIEIKNYAMFHMKANTTVEVNDIFKAARVTVKKGRFLTIVRSGKSFHVTTPMVLAGVRGTVLFVNVLDEKRVYLCDCNGNVDLLKVPGKHRLKSIESDYHTAFNLKRTGSGLQITRAGLFYHHDRDILKMAERFPKETEIFRKRKDSGY
jgi:hypothetical protein